MTDTRKEKSYSVLSPDQQSEGILKADPDLPATYPTVLPCLSLMLAHASGREAIGDGEFNLLCMALDRFAVTTDEAMEAFWRAYADPYVSQGRIEFRHLWKYISDRRGEKVQTYTYHQMLSEMSKLTMPQEAFEILNGENGRPEEKDAGGKFKWRLKQ